MENTIHWTGLTPQMQKALYKASNQATVFCGTYGEANRSSCLSLVRRGLMRQVTINTFGITKMGRSIIPMSYNPAPDLSAEDILILKAADEIYCFDWRENDDDDKTAGWRHPGYFTEVNLAYDFSKLVKIGLMECDNNIQHTPSYRISENGMQAVKAYNNINAIFANDMTPAEIAEYESKQDDMAMATDVEIATLKCRGAEDQLRNAVAKLEKAVHKAQDEIERLQAENARLSAALESLKKQESDQFNRYVKQVNSTIIGYSDEFGYIMNNETVDYIILQTPLDGESRWVARHPAIQEAIDGGLVEVVYTTQYVNDQGKGYTVRLTESGKRRQHDWFEVTREVAKKKDSEAQ